MIFTTDVAAPVPVANTADTSVATTYVNSILVLLVSVGIGMDFKI